MSPPLKSAQPGIARGRKRRSPAGGAKKNTSCRVGRMRRADHVGKELGQPRAEREDELVGARCVRRRTERPRSSLSRSPRGRLRGALRDRCRRAGRTGRPASAPRAAPSARRSRARTGRLLIPSKSIIGKRRVISPGSSTRCGRPISLCAAMLSWTYGSSVGKKNRTPHSCKIGRPETALSAFHCGKLVERHAGVDRVLAISAPGQAGFSAGRGAACARAPGVDQRDLDGPAAAGDAPSRRRTRRRRPPRHALSCPACRSSPRPAKRQRRPPR